MQRFKAGIWWIVAIGLAAVCVGIGLFLSPIEGYTVKDARRTAQLLDAKSLGLATLLYTTDNDEVFPPAVEEVDFVDAIKPFWTKLQDQSYSSAALGQVVPSEMSFDLELSGLTVYRIDQPTLQPMIYDTLPMDDDSRAVCFEDGHAQRVLKAGWWDVFLRMKPVLMPEAQAKVYRLYEAMADYESAHGFGFPVAASQADLKNGISYLVPSSVWKTPDGPISFDLKLSGGDSSNVRDAGSVPEFYTAADASGGRVVCFVDGKVREVSGKEWQDLVALTRAK